MPNIFTLGINFLHSDSSACLFKNNKLIAASEEERFTRFKHTGIFPKNSIIFCLNFANIKLSDVEYVTINSNPFSSLLKKFFFLVKNPASFKIAVNSLKNSKKKISLVNRINEIDKINKFKGKIKYIDHHESHIASSLYFSDFKESINVSVDGFGDFVSCAWGIYKNNKLKITNKINFPHSLGIFYQSITQFLGFNNYGDEYKVMGLSPYGKPKYKDEISKLIYKTQNGFKLNLEYFLHHKQNVFEINNNGQFIYKDLFSNKIINLLGKKRLIDQKIEQKHMDLARSAQDIYEDIFLHILKLAHSKNDNIKNLNLSGGCAMNSVANGKILNNTNFKNIYISPNPGDAGGSIGSSLIFLDKNFNYNFDVENYSYLGNSFSNDEISNILKRKKLNKTFDVNFFEDYDLYDLISNQLINEKIVGWFKGRMEWGPRSLGNRSILADARNPKMKDIINKKIKRRESFRPFAPSILEEYVSDWFEVKKKVPFMSEVYKIKKDKRNIIPSVSHVDGTGRLQTVNIKNNEKYYQLIKNFFKQTKVPIILNTSFNENEPIVNNPLEAINCFERTNMDTLVLENWVISRK